MLAIALCAVPHGFLCLTSSYSSSPGLKLNALNLLFFFFCWLVFGPDVKFNEIRGVPSPMLFTFPSNP